MDNFKKNFLRGLYQLLPSHDHELTNLGQSDKPFREVGEYQKSSPLNSPSRPN